MSVFGTVVPPDLLQSPLQSHTQQCSICGYHCTTHNNTANKQILNDIQSTVQQQQLYKAEQQQYNQLIDTLKYDINQLKSNNISNETKYNELNAKHIILQYNNEKLSYVIKKQLQSIKDGLSMFITPTADTQHSNNELLDVLTYIDINDQGQKTKKCVLLSDLLQSVELLTPRNIRSILQQLSSQYISSHTVLNKLSNQFYNTRERWKLLPASFNIWYTQYSVRQEIRNTIQKQLQYDNRQLLQHTFTRWCNQYLQSKFAHNIVIKRNKLLIHRTLHQWFASYQQKLQVNHTNGLLLQNELLHQHVQNDIDAAHKSVQQYQSITSKILYNLHTNKLIQQSFKLWLYNSTHHSINISATIAQTQFKSRIQHKYDTSILQYCYMHIRAVYHHQKLQSAVNEATINTKHTIMLRHYVFTHWRTLYTTHKPSPPADTNIQFDNELKQQYQQLLQQQHNNEQHIIQLTQQLAQYQHLSSYITPATTSQQRALQPNSRRTTYDRVIQTPTTHRIHPNNNNNNHSNSNYHRHRNDLHQSQSHQQNSMHIQRHGSGESIRPNLSRPISNQSLQNLMSSNFSQSQLSQHTNTDNTNNNNTHTQNTTTMSTAQPSRRTTNSIIHVVETRRPVHNNNDSIQSTASLVSNSKTNTNTIPSNYSSTLQSSPSSTLQITPITHQQSYYTNNTSSIQPSPNIPVNRILNDNIIDSNIISTATESELNELRDKLYTEQRQRDVLLQQLNERDSVLNQSQRIHDNDIELVKKQAQYELQLLKQQQQRQLSLVQLHNQTQQLDVKSLFTNAMNE